MMDNLKAIYEDVNFHLQRARHSFEVAVVDLAEEYRRPSVLFKPELFKDGNMWCALLGANLQEGIAAFGETPEKAMKNFDKAWKGEPQ